MSRTARLWRVGHGRVADNLLLAVLVAVIPGLMAMATIGCGLTVVDPDRAWVMAAHLSELGEWMLLPIVLTVIVVNQSIGILIEELLIQLRLLGGRGAGPHRDRRYRQYA